MKYKSTSIPAPSEGVSFDGIKSEVVPDQSLSLKEILERFTRGEPLAIGREPVYHDSEDDIAKLPFMDLVDQEEYRESLLETQRVYTLQQKERERKAIEEEIRRKAQEEEARRAPSSPVSTESA